MKKVYFLLLILLFNSVLTFAQNHWAQRVWGIGFDIGFGVTSDNLGNVYNTGVYNGDGHFGSIIIPNPTFAYEAYIAKYNQEGVALWANRAGGSGITESHAVFTDAQYNVYITGYFDSSATFGSTVLTSAGMKDIFISKLDSAGNFLWAISAGGPGNDNGQSISVDVFGNVFVAGYFSQQCDFGGTALSSFGDKDVFVAKYDNNGILTWVRSGGSNDDISFLGADRATGIVNDIAGNAYVCGNFIDTAYFDNDTLISLGSYDAFTAKYSSNGTLIWIKSGGGASGDIANGIAMDQAGKIHITGSVYTDIPVQFSGQVLNGGGGDDLFHVSYDSLAGNLISAFLDGGGADQTGNAISVDLSGNIYITGQFLDSANFSTATYLSNGAYDAHVVVYDDSDNLINSKQYGGDNYDVGYGITTDNFGNCTSTGYFHHNTTFGNTSLTSVNADAYLATLNDTIVNANGFIVTNFHTGNSFLRSNNLVDITGDKNNVIYAATADSGVFRFDGTLWQNINCPSNNIKSLFADSVNNIWISTSDLGLFKYDGVSFTVFNTGNSGLPTNDITCVTALPGGAIWIGTKGNGCVRYNGVAYTIFDMSNSILPDNEITSMNCDSSGTIWMGTGSGGMASFFTGVFTIYDTGNSLLPDNKINGACAQDDIIWVATDSGLAFFDDATSLWTVYNSSNGLPTDEFNDIYITSDGYTSTGSRKKGSVINSGTVQRVADTGNSLFDNNVTTVFTDTTGKVIWLGTQYNGVYRLVDTVTVTGINIPQPLTSDFNVSYYPNPASGKITLDYNLKSKSAVEIILTDLKGGEIKRYSIPVQLKGMYKYSFDSEDLSDGLYFITVIVNEGVNHGRILKIGGK